MKTKFKDTRKKGRRCTEVGRNEKKKKKGEKDVWVQNLEEKITIDLYDKSS